VKRGIAVLGLSLLGCLCLVPLAAQEHSLGPGTPAPQQARPLVAYPDRPKASPESIDRGKAIYSTNCGFCHGSDAGGGAVGPNLLRSGVVLDDNNGEKIGPIVHGARVDRGMPKFAFSDAEVSDLAAYLHSLHVTSHYGGEKINIVVGDAKTGEETFRTRCSSCHSVAGDLKGFATTFPDPKTLQQTWLFPGSGGRPKPGDPDLHIPPTTATVTLPDGTKVSGTLGHIDDFSITLTDAQGKQQSFVIDNDVPKVELHDPLAPHRQLLFQYTDKEIHDITAYLVTIK